MRGQSFGFVHFFAQNAGCNILLLAFLARLAHNSYEVIHMNKISTTIKRLRLEKKINQEQLAEQLNVTRQAVSNWETGKTQPDIETLTNIAAYFDVSVEYLIYGKEPVTHSGEEVRRWVWGRGRFHFAINWYPERFVALGVVLAMIISYVNWRSIGWALLHGLLNWGYVLYYMIRY